MSSVSLREVRKKFGTVTAINGVSVEIADGEFVVLVGPSGCGKSTLLRIIAGLEDITSGEVVIGNKIVNDIKPKERDIAMVFQSYALYPHMSVAKNMSFSLSLSRTAKSVIDQKVNHAASILGLEDLLERFPKQLSGGQRQRVAMGRAIVRDPKAFLFDEPLSNLDAKLRVQMRTEIKELHQRLKTTTIYVTHDQIEAMTMADKIVVMRNGLVEQMGTPLDLYDKPDNTFVASFIGSPSMNFVTGVVRGGKKTTLVTADREELPLSQSAAAHNGREVIYGVRPQHLTPDRNGIKVKVVVIEPTGAETQIHAKLGTQSLVADFRDRVDVKPGDTIQLAPEVSSVHLFDKDTGKRLNA
ncbi:MAG: sn-glycerol-3-phosphate ABC transporter ATP-binding protein UgpC [Pseudomonadota bacterium]